MRGRRSEKKRGGKALRASSSAGTGQGGAKRPHSRGRISKGRNSLRKKSRENLLTSRRPEFRQNERQHGRKKEKKRIHSQQHQGEQRHQEREDNENDVEGGMNTQQRKRKIKTFRVPRVQGTEREGSVASSAAKAFGGPQHQKVPFFKNTKENLRTGERKHHERKKLFGGSTSGGKRQEGLENRDYLVPAAEESSAGAATPLTAGNGEAATDIAENELSISKKRKLEAEKKRKIRKHDGDYIKQCFRLYGQLLAAPRSVEGEDCSTNSATEDSDKTSAHQSKQEGASGVSRIRRSSAVQKAAAALYSFILPRVKQNDQHLCTSRSIQALLKYGADHHRRNLWKLLKDAFPELCSGRHTCQLAMKLYLYGDSVCQQEIRQMLKNPRTGKPIFFSKLLCQYHYAAFSQAQMLNPIMLPPLAVVRHPGDAEVLPLPSLFEKFDPETKKLTLDHLAAVVQSCVDKELLDRAPVHKLLQLYTTIAPPETLQDLMNVTAEGFLRLASTKSGVEAMVTLSGFATAKQRKHMIKEMKKHLISMAKNAVDCVFVLRLLCTVDDTRLLTEGILQIVLTDINELIADPYGQLILLQLLEDSGELSRYLPPPYRRLLELPSPTSLKRADIRQNELRRPVLEALETTFLRVAEGSAESTQSSTVDPGKQANHGEDLDEPIRAGQQQIRVPPKDYTLSDWIADPKASRILTMLFRHSSSSSVFSALVAYFSRNRSTAVAYVDRPEVQRFLSGIAKQMKPLSKTSLPLGDGLVVSDSSALKKEVFTTFLRDLWSLILKPQLDSILTTRGVFVVNDVLEAARRLALKDLEEEVVRCLNPAVLSEARATLIRKGSTSVGLDILLAKLVPETAKLQM